MSVEGQKATRDLLARAHSPDTVDRIYNDKIQYRTLHLRPTSPPPAVTNARAARRRVRQQTKDRKKQKPKPLSSRERRNLGLYDIPRDQQKYEVYQPLNNLWKGYILEVLGNDVYNSGPNVGAKLASAEYHGAFVEVVRSKCPGRVGISGIVVKDRKFVMEVITEKRGVKVVPKEGTTFRVAVDISSAKLDTAEGSEGKGQKFIFDVLGDQMMVRSADRANRKFKMHFLPSL